jgi:ADP-ribose pyrophosphatase YjhB (NUDIX family)
MKKINARGETLEQFLDLYNPKKYDKPSLTTDAVIFTIDDKISEEKNRKALQILLVKRKDHPCIGQWALPGGFLNMEEGLHECAKRELGEETHIDVFMEQLRTIGDNPHRDPRDRIISVAYMALIDKRQHHVIADDDAEDAKWFRIERSEKEDTHVDEDSWGTHHSHRITHYLLVSDDGKDRIEFDLDVSVTFTGYNNTDTRALVKNVSQGEAIAFDHSELIDYALTRLMGKIDYEPIALSLLPKTFTLKELMEVYEVIKNDTYSKKNFHRNILKKGFLKETGDLKQPNGKGKPAKLYTFDFNWAIWNRR